MYGSEAWRTMASSACMEHAEGEKIRATRILETSIGPTTAGIAVYTI